MEPERDLLFVSFVSACRMSISQRSLCLKRTWKTQWVCTTLWRPRPRTMRRSPMCLNWRLPTGGSCSFKPSKFCWFDFFLFLCLYTTTLYREENQDPQGKFFELESKPLFTLEREPRKKTRIRNRNPGLKCFVCYKVALWHLVGQLPSLELLYPRE